MLDKMYEVRLRKESLDRLRALLGDGRAHVSVKDAFTLLFYHLRHHSVQFWIAECPT